MQTAKVSDYRSSLAKYHQRVMEDHDPLRVASRSGDVVILAADDYENLMETIYVLKDEATMSSLLETRADMSRGAFRGVKVEDGFKDIVDSET